MIYATFTSLKHHVWFLSNISNNNLFFKPHTGSENGGLLEWLWGGDCVASCEWGWDYEDFSKRDWGIESSHSGVYLLSYEPKI